MMHLCKKHWLENSNQLDNLYYAGGSLIVGDKVKKAIVAYTRALQSECSGYY